MLLLLISFISLSDAFAFPIVDRFYNGEGLARGPAMQVGYYAPPVAHKQVFDDGLGYQSAELDYRRIGEDEVAKEVIRDAGAVSRRGSDSRSRGHVVFEGNDDARGYYSDEAGKRFKAGRDAAGGTSTNYGNVAHDGYGGFGSEGHRKGHKTTGFHKTYHNVESGKDTKFLDEDHSIAHEGFDKAHGTTFSDKGWENGGKSNDEDVFVDGLSHKSASGAASRNEGAHKMSLDGHDGKGYYHNRDLAHKQRQAWYRDNNAGNYGYAGAHQASAHAAYPDTVW